MLTDDMLQLHPFQVVPDSLIRVQLGSVGWQLLQMDALPGRAGQKGFNLLAPVDGAAIPVDHQGQQVAAGLVYEDDGPAFLPGLFFKAGQRSFFQSWMAASSRWAARRTGCWRLQRYPLRMRPTWEGWYWTPKWRRMTWAILGWVQASPRKPKAWGPWAKSSSNWSPCWWVNLGRRPGGLRWPRACGPSALARLSHWLTAPLVTPRASAMCCWGQSFRDSSQARRRRPSRQLVACWERGAVIHSSMPVLQPDV